jgi:hypothetical protein
MAYDDDGIKYRLKRLVEQGVLSKEMYEDGFLRWSRH